jgi:hypothetical protein
MRNAVFIFALTSAVLHASLPGCATSQDDVLADRESSDQVELSAEAADRSSALSAQLLPAATAFVDPSNHRVMAAASTWSFVDVPESRCANGESTGFGINPAPGSDEMMVYLQGGGACWNLATCGIGTATNIRRGYTAQDFNFDGTRSWAIFSRSETKNPFRNMNQVIVPYCTADVHAGTRTTNYGLVTIAHRGGLNIEAMLTRIKATYPNLRRLIVVGTSAGGFGAQLNYQRFVDALPGARIDVVADSAQLIHPVGSLAGEWARNWGLVVPQDCSSCLDNYPDYVGYLLRKYPAAHFGLFASLRDIVLTPFFNFGINFGAFRGETAELIVNQYDDNDNARYFARSGVRHGYLSDVRGVTSRENKATFSFLNAFVAGTAENRRPF